MPIWPAKDPGAVLDYVYRIALDAGDSVPPNGATFTKLSGDVAIDSQALAAAPDTTAEGYGQNYTVFLSGGTDGGASVFKIEWETVAGRTDDDFITLTVASRQLPALALTGYAKPEPGHLVLRYPAFADERSVDLSWSEGDYAAALMALAAHNMALAGLGADAALQSVIPSGVSRFRSGSLDVSLTEAAANARATGSFAATRYGQEYQLLLRRNRSGPLVSDTGVLPTPDYPPFVNGWW
jgi:hypothetical protein